MGSSTISLGLGLGGGKAATSSGTSGGGGGFLNQYSVNLDGTNDYIQLPNGVLTTLTSTTYTLSFWYNLDIVGYYQELFTADNNLQVYFRPRGTEVGLEMANNGALRLQQLSPYSSINSWVHACISVDTAGTSTMFINGNSVDSSTTIPQTTGISNPVIGSFNGSSLYVNGLVDEVAIFNTALSAPDVSTLRGGASAGSVGVPADISSLNPVGWWRMGDGTEAGSGTTVYDMSSNSNNGTLTNGPTYSTDVPT